MSKSLVTGGTGTVGQALAEKLKIAKIFSRNEDAQLQMKKRLPNLEYFTGSVCNRDECYNALLGCDTVYHLAAMKHVGRCEIQPQEAIKTNVLGTMNILNASLAYKINKFVYLSTDKVVAPVSVYGKTKQLAEEMVLKARGMTDMNIIVIRSGNILGSSNSILPILKEQVCKENRIKITNGEMTRFFVTLPDLVKYLTDTIYCDDVFIPPMKAFRLIDLASKVQQKYGNPETEITTSAPLPSEKIHEEYMDKNGNIYSSKDFVTQDYEV